MLSSSPPVTFDLAKYPTVDTIRLLASLLERMTAANDLLNKQQPVYTRFHARLVPSIDIFSYLSRILKYCPCANECFLSLLVYFDRMSKNALALTGKPFTIDSFNIHRLIIAGVMVASKFFSDKDMLIPKQVGGLPVTELNSLEIEFLKLNSFNLTVPISELQRYGDQLLKVGYMDVRPIRHVRSTSLDVDRLSDYTQRLSISKEEHKNNHQKKGVRRMTSANSLQESYHLPRYSRSSVNLCHQYNSPRQEVIPPRRISITSIYNTNGNNSSGSINNINYNEIYYYYHPTATTPIIGIPTPPPSASPQQQSSIIYL
ncbi:Putative Cyclin-domain-containing protein [Rhizopus microsporus]|nr:Putative Cyclin-domain-containing protein [Rhizopus microsporus]